MTTSATTAAVAEPPAPVAAEISRLGLDRHGYLFGHKLANSLSPFFHDVIYQHFGLRWSQFRLESDDVEQFMRLAQHPDFYGGSVTMPNKVAVMRHLDEVTEECRDVGACNTIFIRQDPSTGRRLLCGTNTDVVGIRYSFEQNVRNPEKVYQGRPALVIGGGGAARSAVYALRKWLGVGTIYLVNRDVAEVEAVKKDCVGTGYGTDLLHVQTVEQAQKLEGPGAIVSCVPDFAPQSAAERLARDITETFLNKKDKGAMLEMCYNPTPFTRLGALAQSKGWQVILGTEALIGQGLEQDKYWTGKTIEEMPLEKIQRLIAEKIAAKSVQANL